MSAFDGPVCDLAVNNQKYSKEGIQISPVGDKNVASLQSKADYREAGIQEPQVNLVESACKDGTSKGSKEYGGVEEEEATEVRLREPKLNSGEPACMDGNSSDSNVNIEKKPTTLEVSLGEAQVNSWGTACMDDTSIHTVMQKSEKQENVTPLAEKK